MREAAAEVGRESNAGARQQAALADANQSEQHPHSFGISSAGRPLTNIPPTPDSTLSEHVMEEDGASTEEAAREVSQRGGLKGAERGAAGVPQDPRRPPWGRSQSTRASRPIVNRSWPDKSSPPTALTRSPSGAPRESSLPAERNSQLGVRSRELARRHTPSPLRDRERFQEQPPPPQRHRGEQASGRLEDDRQAQYTGRCPP